MSTQHTADPRRYDNSPIADVNEPHLRDLLKRLASDGGDLVRSEMALAKLEMRDMARELATDSAKLGMALALALTGALALTAAAIIGLGYVLDGRYALSALIIGAILVVIGGIMARSAMTGLKNGPRVQATKQSLQRDREFVRQEVHDLKQHVRS